MKPGSYQGAIGSRLHEACFAVPSIDQEDDFVLLSIAEFSL
jgi:hypothetical protein